MARDIRIHLIRHGESVDNVRAEFIGTSDAKLTERGEHQSRLVGIRLVNEGIFPYLLWASPLERASQTVEIIQRSMEPLIGRKPMIEYANALIEHQNGDWEGRPVAEVHTPEVHEEMRRLAMEFTPPNGESLGSVQRRMSDWFNGCVANMRSWPEDQRPAHLVAVSHGLAIKCLLYAIMEFTWRYTWAMVLDNASITTLRLSGDMWYIDRINDTRHLPLSY